MVWPVRYRIEDNIDYSWVDMREVRPRTRARLKDGQPAPVWVEISKEGVLTYDASKIDIDTYQGEGYEDVRAEGEAYWAARDANDSNVNEEE